MDCEKISNSCHTVRYDVTCNPRSGCITLVATNEFIGGVNVKWTRRSDEITYEYRWPDGAEKDTFVMWKDMEYEDIDPGGVVVEVWKDGEPMGVRFRPASCEHRAIDQLRTAVLEGGSFVIAANGVEEVDSILPVGWMADKEPEKKKKKIS